MFKLRSPLILAAAPAGAVLGAIAWVLLGPGASVLEPVAALQVQFAVARPHVRHTPSLGLDWVAQAAAQPLFALTTGAGAVTDVVVRLDGIARSPRRTAALLSVNGGPAAWLEVGETRDGLTLQEVRADKVVLDTVTGFKEVGLFDAGAPSPGASPAGPPPPASAPNPSSPQDKRGPRRQP